MYLSLKTQFTNNKIILFILFVSTVLRLGSATQIPFTHDEFSALFRTDFKTFHDLIEFGVKPDGHPALIQIFLFYWVKLFGFNELGIKLPFILLGIASVYLIYIIANKWFNKTAGLISAAFTASLQYPVMYSQIARPYISGLFFSLLMVWFWSNLIQNPYSNFWKNGPPYVLFSTLCAYNHHFSLLFALIVGITGFFVIAKKFLIKYLILAISIFVLYLPHLSIFFYQLQNGSIEDWLGKPQFSFFTDYIQYIFHFSLFVGLLAITIFVFGLFKMTIRLKPYQRYFIISIIWFILPIIIGFIYSYLFSAVLQYSVLIFSFPYLLFIIFGNFPILNFKYNLLIVLLIMSVNITSLIYERQHYKLFYQSPYEQILIENQNAQNLYKNNCVSIISSHRKITEYYLTKDLNPNFIWFDTFKKPIDFLDFLKNQNAEYIAFGCLSNIDPVAVNMITSFYPNPIKILDYVGGNFYVFSKNAKSYITLNQKSSLNDFESKKAVWENPKPQFITDSIRYSGNYSYLMDENQEYSPAYMVDLNELIENENDFIDISALIYSKSKLNDVLIVSSIESDGVQVDWRASDVSNFIRDTTCVWQKAHHSIKLSDITLSESSKLKVFIWNKGKRKFNIDDFNVKSRKGNPVIYGLFEKI